MKLLLDQNLSRRLVDHLQVDFPGSTHVASIGLDTSTDREIWEFAGAGDFVVTSKDSDFRQLAFLLGAPPKVVWLRVGNTSTTDILAVLLSHTERIERFVNDADESLLVLSAQEA